MREMIVANDLEQREKALAKLLPMQKNDFKEIYKAMEGRPVTIRFLDPPLHEFLPTDPEDIKNLADDMGLTVDELTGIIEDLHEFNPDAWASRRPAGHHLSRDRCHADACGD